MNRAQISMKLIKGCHNYHAQLFIIYFKFSLRGMTHEFYLMWLESFLKIVTKDKKNFADKTFQRLIVSRSLSDWSTNHFK